MERVTIAVCDECGFENSKDNFCENCNKEIQWSTFIEEAEYKQAAQDLARITDERDALIEELESYHSIRDCEAEGRAHRCNTCKVLKSILSV